MMVEIFREGFLEVLFKLGFKEREDFYRQSLGIEEFK